MNRYREICSLPETVNSIGERFPYGTFGVIHSRFSGVINFMWKSLLVSVCNMPSLAGAFSLVIDNYELQAIRSIVHSPGKIIINGERSLFYDNRAVFCSALPVIGLSKKTIDEKYHYLRKQLQEKASQESIGFLLYDQRDSSASVNTFEEVLKQRIQEAYRTLLSGEFRKAVHGFKGCGYGLTPSGDDFLTGLLIGLSFRIHLGEHCLRGLKQEIYELALSSNVLVNSFFYQAANGLYNYKWKRFLCDLLLGRREVEESFFLLLSTGETSGADSITGFLTAFKLENEDC